MKNIIVTMAGVLFAGVSSATVSPAIAPMPPAAPAPAHTSLSSPETVRTLAWLSAKDSVERLETEQDKASSLAKELAGDIMVARALACKAKAAGLEEEYRIISDAVSEMSAARHAAIWQADTCQKLCVWYAEWWVALNVGNDTYEVSHILEHTQRELHLLDTNKNRIEIFHKYMEERSAEFKSCTKKVEALN